MKQFLFLVITMWILVSACNEPTLVGSGLLDDESLDVGFSDTTTIIAKTVVAEPSRTFINVTGGSFNNSTYMVGVIDDPVFGRSEAVSYFTPSFPFIYPDLTKGNLDSVVVSIFLDTLGFYGSMDAVHELELKMIAEELDLGRDSILSSDLVIETLPQAVGNYSMKVNARDSLEINPYVSDNPDTLIKIGPELRMKLDKQFWVDLQPAGDTLDVEELRTAFPGLALSSTPSESSMIGLNLFTQNSSPANVIFYYTEEEEKRIYSISLGRYRHSTFTQDYTGSDLATSLETTDSEVVYLQSQAGSNIALDVSSIRDLDDQILNNAELKLIIKPDDNPDYEPAEAIFAWARNTDGELDVVGGPTSSTNVIETVFVSGESKQAYSINMTNHFNSLKKDENNAISDTIFLIASSKSQRPNRSQIYSPEHLQFPLKVELILTKP